MDLIHVVSWILAFSFTLNLKHLSVSGSSVKSVAYTTDSCKFRCNYNIVIPCGYKCDGHKDCLHGEDEEDCEHTKGGLHLTIIPDFVVVRQGDTVIVNCLTKAIDKQILDFKWQAVGYDYQDMPFQQVRPEKFTVSLYIRNAQPENSGIYRCKLHTADGRHTSKLLQIRVNKTDHNFSASSKNAVANTEKFCRFICHLNIHIACHYRCDGQIDCPSGEDEKDCPEMSCEGKFRCNNSRCIDYAYVCDKENHCDDWSDEDRCTTVITDAVPADTSEEDEQMIWLKTTVYTVIACTVGIVFLISIIVIAIFRIKMKRAAVRRALRQAERRRHHGNRSESRNSSQAQRNDPVENEPFISAPSPTHFGNIIVNVNNGVQYVPNAEFAVGIQSPPTYSEVMAETGRVGRNSPPPEYSTIDRNPNRVSQIEESDLHIQLSSENRYTENTELQVACSSVEHDNCDTSDIQRSVSVDDYNSVTNRSENAITTTCSDHTPSGAGTNSLGRHETSSQSGRHPRNVRSVCSPCRPKQLKVCDGQIVLDDDSSNSSSPETVNRNTQTTPADISTAVQSVKPAQIQVQDGQIILASQDAESSISASETDGAFAQGQLDVKDGHIVFKPAGT